MAAADKEPTNWLTLALRVGLSTLRDLTARRRLMFYLTISAMVQLALGLLILNQLSKFPILFVLYWAFCLLQVGLMILFALYDMLTVRQDQRAELARLRQTIVADNLNSSPRSTHADDPEKPGKT
jgi:hypothetical protein